MNAKLAFTAISKTAVRQPCRYPAAGATKIVVNYLNVTPTELALKSLASARNEQACRPARGPGSLR
jgi:hypothetical protein